jgi:hypothetical protein
MSHRRNAIASLTGPSDNIITNHDKKSGILWESFRSRMGVSDFSGISYDLSSLLQRQDLDF